MKSTVSFVKVLAFSVIGMASSGYGAAQQNAPDTNSAQCAMGRPCCSCDPKAAISVYSNALSFSNAEFGGKTLRNTTMLGLRYKLNAQWGIDVAIGAAFNSSIAGDTATMTSNDAGVKDGDAAIGVYYRIGKSNSAASIGVAVSGGAMYQQWFDNETIRDTTRVYNTSAPTAAGRFVTYTKTFAYSVIIPYIFAGVEPAYCFDKHFSLYSRFGVNCVFYPNSKYVDKRSSAYDIARAEFDTPLLTLSSHKDASTQLSVSSFGLGVRYYF